MPNMPYFLPNYMWLRGVKPCVHIWVCIMQCCSSGYQWPPVRIYTCGEKHLREFTTTAKKHLRGKTPARIYKPRGKTSARNYKPRGFTPTAEKQRRVLAA